MVLVEVRFFCGELNSSLVKSSLMGYSEVKWSFV